MDTDGPIDWDAIEDQYDGAAIDLNYAYVFEESDDEEQGEHELEHVHVEDLRTNDSDAAAGSTNVTGHGRGLAGRGVPGSGQAGRGVPGAGAAGRGVPGSGQAGRGVPGEGEAGRGVPGSGQAGRGIPSTGQAGRGVPGSSQVGRGVAGRGQAGRGGPDSGHVGQAMAGRSGGGRGHGRGCGQGHGEAVHGRGRGRLGLAGRGRGTISWQETQRNLKIGSGRGRGRLGLAGRGVGRGMTLDMNAMAYDDDADEPVVDGADQSQGNQEPIKNGLPGCIKRQWSEDEKLRVYGMLLEWTSLGKLKRGVTKEVARISHMPLRTVQEIWKRGKRAGSILGVMSKKPKNCGRKKITLDPEAIKQVPPKYKTTLLDLANALGMSRSTLHRRLKEGKLRRHTNAIKSTLTDENKKRRVQWCLSQFQEESMPDEPTFSGMFNVIHIDEKWFFRTRKSQKFYLALDEPEPERVTQNKNYIEKVMFLAAVARPRYDVDGTETFDGRIGIWPFTFEEAAKRDSPNRLKGTMVTKLVTSVTKDVSREWLVNKVLPAIKEKWPAAERGRTIYIQQDNARTHIDPNDPVFVAAATADGWDIRLVCQPPNSPDLNILDLGFFAALQSLFHKLFPGSVDDIVLKVHQAYYQYPVERSNRIFLTLQSCMIEILKQKGGNHYKIPHMRKLALQALGILPVRLECTRDIVDEAMEWLGD